MTALPRGETPGHPSDSDDEPAAEEQAAEEHAAPAEPDPQQKSEPESESADGPEPEAESADGPEPEAGPERGGEPALEAPALEAPASEAPASEAPASTGAGPDEKEPGGSDASAGGLSEAQAELAAQRELRARIEERKAAKGGPLQAGGKLSGSAADLLAAVRAVESGEQTGAALYDSPAPPPRGSAPRPAAPEPVRTAPAPERRPHDARRAASPEAVAAVRSVLAEGGAPEAFAARVAEALGETAADALREDPWRLLAVPGLRPEQADGFARALLGAECGPDDGRRAVALTGWLLQQAAERGHTAVDADEVRAALAERRVPDPDEAVRHTVAEGAVLVFREGADGEHEEEPDPDPEGEETAEAGGDEGGRAPGRVLLGLDRYAMAEESLADGLARIARTAPEERWRELRPAELAGPLAEHGLVLHTGGEEARREPVALADAAHDRGLRATVAAYTGDGVRRTPRPGGGPGEGSGEAGAARVTVGGLLSGAAGPGRDEEGALALDLLVVLDAPRLDVETAAMLVEALPDGCRLVLSGDPGELWSAGAGRVFADVLAAGVCPKAASRLPDHGPIGELVSGIGVGELNQVAAPGKEVVIVPVRDAGEAVHRTVQLVADSVPRAIGVPVEHTQVITVGHGGSAGTRALNATLKERLNPGPGRFGGFDPGDRVAYTPAPGRTVPGMVVSADAEGLHLDCGETGRTTVPKDAVESSVRHGWALTAHQAAGTRWPAAVVVLPGDAAPGLDRAWVYTAFGRGERHLSVVHGVDQALPRAVAEILPRPRTTRLTELLTRLLAPATDD
ncbi:helix-hairpin-helix domain-containing protein [Streptomyces sp. NPDC046887]|uniref:helix-hairpin-helix domain-containing protein n=1 Tax=Streptomyces sp. NPDC046887 TaxID=3155472 RepID=UPI0033E1B5A8